MTNYAQAISALKNPSAGVASPPVSGSGGSFANASNALMGLGGNKVPELKFGDNMVDNFFTALDVPSTYVSWLLDDVYDATLGSLTGTKDMFTYEDIKPITDFATLAIPSMGAIRGLKALRNLSNVAKFDKVMDAANAARGAKFNQAVNSIAGEVLGNAEGVGAKKAVEKLGKRVKNGAPAPESVKVGRGKNNVVDLTDTKALAKSLEEAKIPSPVPMYRVAGGNQMVVTPDYKAALAARGPSSRFDRLFNRGPARIEKLPIGTPIAPGMRGANGYEAIVRPEWLSQVEKPKRGLPKRKG